MEIKKLANKVNEIGVKNSNLNERKEVEEKKLVKKTLLGKIGRSSNNYHRELEDQDTDCNYEHSIKPDCKKLYYKYIKETKISCNYICNQLEKKEIIEENCEVEKIITQALESIIDQLVLD